ncbi:hypothetical protein ACLESD_32040 [Pyxidicoccus sp. 3LFB2]
MLRILCARLLEDHSCALVFELAGARHDRVAVQVRQGKPLVFPRDVPAE